MYVIPGNPIPLARARLSRTRVYNTQSKLKTNCMLALQYLHGDRQLYTGPLHIDITFFMAIPSSRQKKITTGQYHTSRPDVDNLAKWILDISNGVLFSDDAIISSITCKKIYDPNPRTEFSISQL